MIPLRDNQPTSTFPIITVLLIVANVLVYIVQLTHAGFDSSFALVPYEVTHNTDLVGSLRIAMPTTAADASAQSVSMYYGVSPHPLWLTIFTSMFMHDSELPAGLLHIGGNMLFLWIFGNNIEDALGKVRFLAFYLASGVAASLLQIAMGPNSLVPNVGASGAIAGVLGAYLLLYPNARVLSIVPIFGFGFIAEVRALWVLLVWVAYDILPGFFGGNTMRGGGGVAYFAHLGGFLAGIIIINLLGGKRLVARQQQRVYYPPPSGGGGYY